MARHKKTVFVTSIGLDAESRKTWDILSKDYNLSGVLRKMLKDEGIVKKMKVLGKLIEKE